MNEIPDLLVFSDGSGYKDGYSGWATIVTTPDRNVKTFRMGATFGPSVDRSEMTGLLEGLEMALFIARTLPKAALMSDENWRPIIVVHTDRENMVLSMKGVYDRSNCPDLWARYAFYEKVLDIRPTQMPRETNIQEFIDCDLHASTGRIIIKSYLETMNVPDFTLPNFK